MKTKYIKRKGMLLSSVAMLGTAMLLTACGGDGGDSPVDDFGSNPGEGDNQALLYAYPDNGQEEISTAAPVVLRFSSAVNLGEAQNSITVYEGDAQSGTVVAVTPESVAGEPNNVLLQPDEDLKPNQIYTVVIEDLRLRKGVAKDQTLTFTTRPLHEGPKNLVVKEDTFEISRRMPDGSAMEPVMDFSSFRFQFTQPIDRATATYGDGNTVVLRDSAGDPVDATLLIDGAYMTVDPDAEYLNAGETYTLDITANLTSTYGETFGTESYTFTPKDSSPGREPAILVQKLTQGTTSRLTGKPVNEVPVNGTLLGENKNITQASAEVVRAELADVTTYTDVTPIRLPKGTVLNGAEINPILIGGEVPAGFGSGDVTMTVLSDASGYLVPNPYAENNPDALRIVHLLMDVGIATSEPRANGAFTQDLMHIELIGLAEVDPEAGVLNLDAVSMVEPDILGQEYGYGMLSFQLQSYKDQNSAPKAIEDTAAPELQSWTLGSSDGFSSEEKGMLYKPGDSLIINFDEPVDPNSVVGKVSIHDPEGDKLLPIDYYVDGASLVVKMKRRASLESGTYVSAPEDYLGYIASDEQNYLINIAPGVADLEGNETIQGISEELLLPKKVTEDEKIVDRSSGIDVLDDMVNHSPVVLATYPGFPCRLDPATRDLSRNIAGRCAGGMPGITEEDSRLETDYTPPDDLIPVSRLPKNRPIIVSFSEDIDSASIRYGVTFSVNEVNSSGDKGELVRGRLEKEPRRLVFYPAEGWEKDKLYQYELSSSGYEFVSTGTIRARIESSENYECGATAICDVSGLPLQTQVLGNGSVLRLDGTNTVSDFMLAFVARRSNDPEAGGPDLIQYFLGGDETDSVLQALTTAPVSDTNANFYTERDTPPEYYALNVNWQESGAAYRFEGVQEYGPTSEPDHYSDETIDPNGVRPSLNSAKVLALPSEIPEGQQPGLWVSAVNMGCGFQERPDNGTNPTPYVFDSPVFLECPENKFTFLTSSLLAEVTSDVNSEGHIKVNIWPSLIMASSIDIMSMVSLAGGTPFQDQLTAVRSGATGPQIMRMRFAGENRNEPVEAWIKNGDTGPILSATVDLYLDIPGVADLAIQSNLGTNMVSYPLRMELEGGITFSDDGRMLVEQYNVNELNIRLKVASASGTYVANVPQIIPERGSLLQYVSDPIK